MKSQRSEKTVLEKARIILQERGYRRTCYPLEDLARDIDNTQRSVVRKVFVYKWTGLALLTLIPILSALISSLLSMDEPKASTLATLTKTLSFSLTLLTILNSIFKPGERFRSICSLGIQVADFSNQALESLERIPKNSLDEMSLLVVVGRLRRHLDSYREQLIDLFLPEASQLPGRRKDGHGVSSGLEEPNTRRMTMTLQPSTPPIFAATPGASTTATRSPGRQSQR
jgi:hypothetical protein